MPRRKTFESQFAESGIRSAEAVGPALTRDMMMELLRNDTSKLTENEAGALSMPQLRGVRKEILPYVAQKRGVAGPTIEVTSELTKKFPALSPFIGRMMPSNGILHFMKPQGLADNESIKLISELSDQTIGKTGMINQINDPAGFEASKNMLQALTEHIFQKRVPSQTPKTPPPPGGGKIRVTRISDGQAGMISEKDFNPKLYRK